MTVIHVHYLNLSINVRRFRVLLFASLIKTEVVKTDKKQIRTSYSTKKSWFLSAKTSSYLAQCYVSTSLFSRSVFVFPTNSLESIFPMKPLKIFYVLVIKIMIIIIKDMRRPLAILNCCLTKEHTWDQLVLLSSNTAENQGFCSERGKVQTHLSLHWTV